MNKQQATLLYMDYLYDEIDPKKKKQLEKYLEDHPSIKEELQKLRQTKTLLQQMPAEESSKQLLMVEPRKRTFREWWQDVKRVFPQTTWGKTGFAAAATLILLVVVSSVANVHIARSEAGFSMTLGQQEIADRELSAEQADELINQIREENAVLLNEFAEEIDRQNRQQLQQVVRYFEEQRLNDLQQINQNLDQYYQANNYRWQQTNELFSEVLQTVSYND